MELSTVAERGPHSVGVATLQIPSLRDPARHLPLSVWYPAAEASEGRAAADHPLNAPHEATPDLAPQPGPLPLVLFSHGNSGLRLQSTFLMTHLASWGLVVAAPDHTGNTFQDMLRIDDEEERKRVHLEARRNRPQDICAVLDHLVAGDVGWPKIDSARIGSLGHSYGGWTALKAPARDPRVGPVCGLAPASEPFVGRKAFDEGELPLSDERPVLIVAGLDDVLVDVASSVAPLFERMVAPCALVGLERTDHFHFCDAVPLLHQMHENSQRPLATRQTLPYANTLPEARIHRLLRGLVTHFFQAAFESRADPLAGFSPEALRELDGAAVRLDAVGARRFASQGGDTA
jgi:dienelactone hydrolase